MHFCGNNKQFGYFFRPIYFFGMDTMATRLSWLGCPHHKGTCCHLLSPYWEGTSPQGWEKSPCLVGCFRKEKTKNLKNKTKTKNSLLSPWPFIRSSEPQWLLAPATMRGSLSKDSVRDVGTFQRISAAVKDIQGELDGT